MMLNPEFRRYCWLELTPHRLIAAPVIAGLILALVAASSEYSTHALAMTGRDRVRLFLRRPPRGLSWRRALATRRRGTTATATERAP